MRARKLYKCEWCKKNYTMLDSSSDILMCLLCRDEQRRARLWLYELSMIARELWEDGIDVRL